MLRAHIVDRRTIACPVCRATEFDTHRREPATPRGHVLNRCVCRRCGTSFAYGEDKSGKPTP